MEKRRVGPVDPSPERGGPADPSPERGAGGVASERLFAEYDGLIRRLARRYSRGHHVDDDLVQVGQIALWHASTRFVPERGEFERFATVTIIGEMKKHLRSNAWAVHVPRGLQEAALTVAKCIDRLTGELERSPTVAEISRATGIADERVVEAMEVRTARYADDLTRFDRRASIDADVVDSIWLRAALDGLDDDDRRLISLRFVDGLTQSEIGRRLGVSQSSIHRHLDRATQRLRRTLDEVPIGEDEPVDETTRDTPTPAISGSSRPRR